ncbi:MAG: polymer-forming cytoskeletal protein [Crocinitomicaceae bacterium]
MFKGNNSKDATVSSNQLNRLCEGTTITGDIVTEGNIRIDCKVTGNLTVKGKVVLGKGGVVEGDMTCLNADIEGTIIGNILVDGLLVLKETAKVEGTIATHKIGVLEGAEFTGTCTMNPNSTQPATKENILLDEKADSEMVY